MQIRFFVLSISALLFCFDVLAQDFQWVKEIKDKSKSTSRLTLVEENDLVLAKNFSDRITVGNNKLESYGKQDFVLIKYDSKGKTDWIKHFGSTAYEEIQSIEGDINGNIFITGIFSGTLSFGTISLNSSGEDDIFIAKLDKKGNCLWAISYGNRGKEGASCLSIDQNGNILVSGSMGKMKEQDSLNLFFITKYDRDGKLLWNKKMISTDSRSQPKALAVNSSDNILVAGIFYDDLKVENTTLFLESKLGKSIPNLFLISLDKSGNLNWSNNLSAVDFDSFISMESALACDESNNIYIGGSFIGSINIGENFYNSSGIGNQDVFIATCTESGSWRWVQTSKGDDSNYGRDYLVALKAHKNGLIYGTGYFDGVLKLGSVVLNENKELYDSDIFIVSIDTTGNIVWGKQAGASSKSYFTFDDDVSDFTVSSREEIYLAGNSDGNARFDKIQLKSQDKTCNYFAKISRPERSIMKETSKTVQDSVSVFIYPNPSITEDITVRIEGTGEKCKIVLFDNTGNLILQLYQGKTKRKEQYQFIIKSTELKEGLYLLKVLSSDSTSSHKIIISK